jgi:hypothetical protein
MSIVFRFFLACTLAALYCSCKYPSNHSASIPSAGKWAIDSFTYSAYHLSLNRSTPKWDTLIVHILKVDGNGHFALARASADAQEYFKGTVPDSLLFWIQAVLSEQKSDTAYRYNPDGMYTYDGDKYILDYYLNNKRNLIQFIPPEAPAAIRHLNEALEAFVSSIRATKVDTLALNGYEREIQRLGHEMTIVPPPRIDSTPFEPVRIDSNRR